MEELEIFELYNNTPNSRIDSFNEKINSALNVKTDYDKVVCNFEWLDLMEDTIRYLDNILRNPNRFIINEEEIVKIELARRVTSESIKHLSRNTNFIQDIDTKTGDVRPSKILNINKDESYDTYENRLIYTLIVNMRTYLSLKKRDMITTSYIKDLKQFNYKATTQIGEENVDFSFTINSKINTKLDNGSNNSDSIEDRIERLEMQINDLTNSEVYKVLHKKHVALVRPPIKKTNVILKNVNFQYAVKLWNYLQEHIDDDTKRQKESKDYYDNNLLKRFGDDCFLLQYLALHTLNKEDYQFKLDEEKIEQITNVLIDKIVNLNSELSEETLAEMLGERIAQAKQNNLASLRQIQNIFSKNINKYLDKIKEFEF